VIGLSGDFTAPGASLLQRRTLRRTRFQTVRWLTVLIIAPFLGLITELLLLIVKATEQRMPALAAFFAIVTLPGLAIVAWIVGLLRPVTLTRSELRIPSGLRTVVIPLNDVAGVGMLYHVRRTPNRSPSAWSVFVWRRNGSVQRVAGLICRKDADAPPSQIAASRAGRMTRRLDAKVRAIQGPTGSLATLELQKRGSAGLASDLVAFWSPDGDVGPARR
jgi:hypothetical protein